MSLPRRSGPSRKGFARIIRSQGHEGSALILGQRPTSPKGAQCYVGPLAHCGSHCCANCITTGSGRDLPSVARNSVSRGLVLGTMQQQRHYQQHRRQTRSTAAVTFIVLRDVIRRINAEEPYVRDPVTCRLFECLSACVGERKLIA